AITRPQTLRRCLADLRRVQADPDLLRVGVVRPEIHELVEIAVALRLLARDRAMDGDLMPLDVLQDAIVGRGSPARVMLGLETIDRDDDLQARKSNPVLRDRTDGTGHEL